MLAAELRPRNGRVVLRPKLPVLSPYFEERLVLAHESAGWLYRELHGLPYTSLALQERAAALARELGRAREEVEYLRSREDEAETVSEPAAPWDESVAPPPTRVAPTPKTEPSRMGRRGAFRAPAPVAGFTSGRYNRTIRELKSRRLRSAATVLLLATGISLALVVLTLSWRAADPPLWVELLPLLWLVSVPFFLLSFHGTQRVLRRNHLELPEAA